MKENQKYTMRIEKGAAKFIDKQPRPQKVRLYQAILCLPAGDVKPIVTTDKFRLRVGDYRVIFTMDDNVLLISVVEVGNRGDIYK